MTNYIVKLVDHRNSTPQETMAIEKSIQRVLGLAFAGTTDGVTVSWGPGARGDNLVIHFVEDIAHSYLRQTWPTMHIDPAAGGHTHAHGALAGTELYRTRPLGPLLLRRYGALAFHEALHNLFPFRGDQHTAMRRHSIRQYPGPGPEPGQQGLASPRLRRSQPASLVGSHHPHDVRTEPGLEISGRAGSNEEFAKRLGRVGAARCREGRERRGCVARRR